MGNCYPKFHKTYKDEQIYKRGTKKYITGTDRFKNIYLSKKIYHLIIQMRAYHNYGGKKKPRVVHDFTTPPSALQQLQQTHNQISNAETARKRQIAEMVDNRETTRETNEAPKKLGSIVNSRLQQYQIDTQNRIYIKEICIKI